MKALTREDVKRKTELLKAIQEAESNICSAIEVLNSAIQEANEFKAEITDRQQEYMDERSEKWMESDAASEYEAWMDQWSEELEEIDEFELGTASDTFENTPNRLGE